MLGSIKTNYSWKWIACGKHPLGKDFFRIGPQDPFFQAFSAWMEKGYQKLGSGYKWQSRFNSWRFWARGPGRSRLICGVVKDSGDTLGRPYPLLVMGSGHLEDWEDHWDLLPYALEDLWRRMEYLMSARFMNLKQWEDELTTMTSLPFDWQQTAAQRSRTENPEPVSGSDTAEGTIEHLATLKEKPELMVRLNFRQSHDLYSQVCLFHKLGKSRISSVPNSLFIGGIPEETYLAVFMRPVTPVDFVRLWTPGQGDSGRE